VWVLWLLLAASIASVAVMADRWRAFRRNRSRTDELARTLAPHLDRGDAAGALAAAQEFDSLEGRVAAAGLERFGMGAAAVADVMEARLIAERQVLERRLIVLGTLGNNAPFVGLFGTVLGVIKAFNDLAVSGSSGVSVVMAGISSALVATAFGILVAIPAVIANNYFETRLNEFVAASERISLLLLAHLKSTAR
ncbi:MAG: MotA/TolQ/ExbB proton channel family protein, partial [bacterium]